MNIAEGPECTAGVCQVVRYAIAESQNYITTSRLTRYSIFFYLFLSIKLILRVGSSNNVKLFSSNELLYFTRTLYAFLSAILSSITTSCACTVSVIFYYFKVPTSPRLCLLCEETTEHNGKLHMVSSFQIKTIHNNSILELLAFFNTNYYFI